MAPVLVVPFVLLLALIGLTAPRVLALVPRQQLFLCSLLRAVARRWLSVAPMVLVARLVKGPLLPARRLARAVLVVVARRLIGPLLDHPRLVVLFVGLLDHLQKVGNAHADLGPPEPVPARVAAPP